MLKELLLVIAITDGDTIKVQNAERETLKVRLANIDAPELGQDYGQKKRYPHGSIDAKDRELISIIDATKKKTELT